MEVKELFERYQQACQLCDDAERQVKDATLYKQDMQAALTQTKKDLLFYMNKHGLLKDEVEIEGRIYSITRKSGLDNVDVPELESVPYEFQRIREIKTPDKIKIKEHLRNNKVNWASLQKGEEILTYELIAFTDKEGNRITAKG